MREIILYGQGYGAIKTWEKKIFYDLLWPNEISDLNNFNTTAASSSRMALRLRDFPKTFLQASESIFSKCSHKNVPLTFAVLFSAQPPFFQPKL